MSEHLGLCHWTREIFWIWELIPTAWHFEMGIQTKQIIRARIGYLRGYAPCESKSVFSLGFWKESATDQFSTLFQVSNPTFYFSILNWSFPRWYLWHKLVFPISTEIISLFRIKILWRRRGKNRWKNLVKIILITNLYKVHIVPKVLLYSIIDSATLFWFTILHWYGRLTALSSGSFLGLGPPWNSL